MTQKTAGGKTRALDPDEIIDVEFRRVYETNDTGYDGIRGVIKTVDPRALEGVGEMAMKEVLAYGGAALVLYGLYKWLEKN